MGENVIAYKSKNKKNSINLSPVICIMTQTRLINKSLNNYKRYSHHFFLTIKILKKNLTSLPQHVFSQPGFALLSSNLQT